MCLEVEPFMEKETLCLGGGISGRTPNGCESDSIEGKYERCEGVV